jgi:4-hydroxyacetophenone monooxygenase
LQEETVRNPHAGEPFTDGDGDIAAALEDVSVPALLCSLVHMTGDPSWIRGPHRPRGGAMFDLQGGLSDDARAEVRRAALPVVAAYRDGGCVRARLDPERLGEMMAFLGARPVEGAIADVFLEDLHFDGADSGADLWGDEVPDDV